MRHSWIAALALWMACAVSVRAQLIKNVSVQAGTPEDRALNEISAATDPAKKLALMENFLAEHDKGNMAILAYQQLIGYFVAQKDFDKVAEYANKLLEVDPDNFTAAVNLVRVAQEKNDSAKLIEAAERLGGIVARFKAQPPPEGADPTAWANKQTAALEEARPDISYVQTLMFNAAYNTAEPAAKAGLLERFAAAFPDSSYTATALNVAAFSYQQAQDFTRMEQAAKKALARDPNDVGMLLLLSDHFSERGQDLDTAEEDAKKALELLPKAAKPAGVSDEQWKTQVDVQTGLAWSSLGQVYIHKSKLSDAVAAFKTAGPLLKSNTVTYARNLYRWGFTLARLRQIREARIILTEAVDINSPYKSLAQETLDKIGGPLRPSRRRR